jgi:mannose-6-phosphate isomerase-like protein (cupin superfamily)
MSSFTLKNLQDVQDQADGFGLGDIQEARFPSDDVEAESTGFGHQLIRPGRRQGFAHRHEAAEEVYVVIGGSGRVKLEDEIVELKRLDALRVAPAITRQFEAGPDGIEMLVFGPRHKGDGEIVQGFWED